MTRAFKATCLGIAALGVGMIAWAELAEAQVPAPTPVCDLTEKIDAFLRGKGFAESSFGIINPQAAMIIYATPGGERWVSVLTGTDGQSCFSIEGEGWFPGAVPPASVEGERPA